MIRFRHKGNFQNAERFLTRNRQARIQRLLEECAEAGTRALKLATPCDTGKTADAWEHKIEKTAQGYTIHWINRHEQGGVNIALILQYGHGTGTGGFVQGTDYINPAIRPLFQAMAERGWKEVKG